MLLVFFPVLVFLDFSVVPVLDGTVVAGNPAVNFRIFSTDRAGKMLAALIAMIRTNGVGRGNGVIGQAELVRDLFDQAGRCFPVGELFSQENMEDGS